MISPRTLKLSHEEADRVVRVAQIVALAEHVFGNRDKALSWLRSTDDRINERTPLSLLRTESGGRLIENMLWQIDEGVYR